MATVLIVDDEPSLREVERELLEDAEHAVLEAATGSEALDCLRRSGETLVVILDHRLPDMDGGEILQLAMEEPRLKRHAFIYASGVTQMSYSPELRAAIEALGVEVVPKPFDVDVLLAAIERCQERLARGK